MKKFDITIGDYEHLCAFLAPGTAPLASARRAKLAKLKPEQFLSIRHNTKVADVSNRGRLLARNSSQARKMWASLGV